MIMSSLYKGIKRCKNKLSRTFTVDEFELWVIKADTKMFVSITAYTIALFS